MSQDTITVDLEERTVLGKGLNHLRAEGKVPAVVHDHGKQSLHVVGNQIQFQKMYQKAGKHHPVELKLDGKTHLTIIKDVDFEPVKHQMRHVVFQAIKQNEKVEAEVPVIIEGEIPAERAGFMLITHLGHVKIEAFPKDLPDELTVDGTVLAEIGDKLSVADIKLPEGVTILEEPETPVATVEETKAQVSEEEATEGEGEEGAEGEEGEAGEGGESAEGEEKSDDN